MSPFRMWKRAPLAETDFVFKILWPNLREGRPSWRMRPVILLAIILATCSTLWGADGAGGLTIKVQGDATQGYGVMLLNNGKPIARHNDGGEFSAIFANADRSLKFPQDNWRAATWTGDERKVVLLGEIQLKEFETVIDVQVQYDVVNPEIVRKKIRFYQPDANLIYFQVMNRLMPVEAPRKLWSFDHADSQGGPLREYFPAAGFRTQDGWTVGLLTDAGFRNGWSRIYKRLNREPGPAMVPTRETPDVNLYKVATPDECSSGQYYVQQTFGELRIQGEESPGGGPAHLVPYHRLEMGQPQEKTVFIFADNRVKDTLHDYRLASQLHFADAFGFKGGPTEKVVWADTISLCWQAEPQVDRAMCAPSILYSEAGEMYMRDSFYAMSGLHNRELNEKLCKSWGDNQGDDGSVGTLIPANVGQRERKSNDSTPQWLMWALKNRQRFGTPLPMDKLRKAAEYCLRTYGKDNDGVCWAQFVMGQDDVIDFPNGRRDVCSNQGVWAVTLRVIKELAIPGISATISEDLLRKAEDGYRGYYDPALKCLTPVRGETNAISPTDLWPEFLSLWLFHRQILSDEMVCNQLDRVPALLPEAGAPYPGEGGTVRPVLIGLQAQAPGWRFFSDTFHPLVSDGFAAQYKDHQKDGIYYNGGSWMQMDICASVVGKLHGWKRADKAIANRLWAEINANPGQPTSQEFLPTDPGNPQFSEHRVFAWNAFTLCALEMAGWRTPDMDPDYQP